MLQYARTTRETATTTSGPVALSFTKNRYRKPKDDVASKPIHAPDEISHFKKLRCDRIRRRTALGTTLLVILRQVLQPSAVNAWRRSWEEFDASRGPQSTLRPAPKRGEWIQVSSKFAVVAASMKNYKQCRSIGMQQKFPWALRILWSGNVVWRSTVGAICHRRNADMRRATLLHLASRHYSAFLSRWAVFLGPALD